MNSGITWTLPVLYVSVILSDMEKGDGFHGEKKNDLKWSIPKACLRVWKFGWTRKPVSTICLAIPGMQED